MRDAVLENTARLFVAVIDGHRISGFSQVVGRRQSSGAGADHCGLLPCLPGGSCIVTVLVLQDIVAQRALHAVDIDAVSMLALVAFHLAVMRADAAGEHRHRIELQNDLRCPVPVVGADTGHVRRDIGTGRALRGAGGGPHLHSAENGVVAVLAADGVALRSALSRAVQTAADGIRIAVEPAAHILAEVAAEGGLVPDNGSRDALRGFRDSLRVLKKDLRALHVAELRHGAD